MSRDCWMPPRSWYPATRTMDLAPPFAIPASMADSSGNPMGPCWESTNSQSYPLCANCSATVGLCEFRNKPSLGCPSRSCFLNSAPLSASLIRSCLLEFGQALGYDRSPTCMKYTTEPLIQRPVHPLQPSDVTPHRIRYCAVSSNSPGRLVG